MNKPIFDGKHCDDDCPYINWECNHCVAYCKRLQVKFLSRSSKPFRRCPGCIEEFGGLYSLLELPMPP